ncbi:MAG: AIR synthase family protein [Atribacterota bacterium]|nr:AIR synthase family protein [Atribacterota bacterium]
MMQLGKLSPEILEKVVLPFQGSKRDEIVYGAELGRDCGVLRLGEDLVAVTCDPITGAPDFLGFFAVQVVVNDLVCSGAEPVAVLVSLIFPPGSTPEMIGRTMQEVNMFCRKFNIAVLGGHTEISQVVRKPLAHCVGLGKIGSDNFPDVTKVLPGDSILMTKGAGIEGTAILAWERSEELEKELGKETVERAKSFLSMMNVVQEARIANAFHPHCLHDVTEGGLLGALWEVCARQSLGFEIEEEKVFVFPETRAIAQHFAIDPLCLISSGTLLIFVPFPERLVIALREASIPVFEIGKITEEPRRIVRCGDGRIREIQTCPQDELWRVVERF